MLEIAKWEVLLITQTNVIGHLAILIKYPSLLELNLD